MKRLLLLAFLPMLLAIPKGIAQTEPIQVNTFLNPPYSPRISDFGRVESTNLQAQIILNDFSIASLDVKLSLTIKGNGITIKTKPNFQPRSPIVLMPGAPTIVMGSQLAEYLSPDNLIFQGYSAQQFRRTGRIPAGFYEFSFQVMHYNRGNALSTAFPTIVGRAWLIQHDPPFTIAPKQGDTIKAQEPQYLTFQWQPRHIGTPGANFATEYRLQLIELWPSDRNPNDAFLSSPILFETTTQATSYAYTVADAQLEKGRRYAYRVQAREYDPTALSTGSFEQSSIFKNNGYSEVVSFDYMEECLPPTGVTARTSGSRAIRVSWTPQYNHLSTDVRFKIVGGINDHVYGRFDITNPHKYIDRFGKEQLIEYSVRGKCEHNYSAYSRAQRIQLPPDKDVDLGACVVNGPLFKDFKPTTDEPLLELKVGDVIKTAVEDITVLKVNKSLGDGWFTGEGEQPFTPWRIITNGSFNLRVTKNYETIKGTYEVASQIAMPLKNLPIDKIRTGVNILNEVVSEVNLNFSSKDKNNTNGKASLPPLDVANILSEGAEAAGEALTALPKAVASIPQETIDVMEGLTQEAEELIEEAKELIEDSPEAAEKLLAQANDKLGQVVNTLESLPDVMESALDGLAALGEDSDYFLQLLKEALEEFNGIMGDTLKKKQQQQSANDQALAEQLAAIEASNLAVEDEQAPLTPLYDEPQLVEDESTFRESEARKQGFTLLRKKKSFFIFLAQLQNVFTYIKTILENEEALKDLSEGFITKRRAEIVKLIQVNKGLKGKEVELKLMMKDYMQSELVFLANEGKENEIEEFTDENLRTAAVAVENHAPLPTDKNYYISPLVPLEHRDSVEMRLEEYISQEQAKGRKVFVNVSYSQDLSDESYIARAKNGRPKELPQEYEYESLHYLNIPGSTFLMLLGSETIAELLESHETQYKKGKEIYEKIVQELRCAYYAKQTSFISTYLLQEDIINRHHSIKPKNIRLGEEEGMLLIDYNGTEGTTNLPTSITSKKKTYRLNRKQQTEGRAYTIGDLEIFSTHSNFLQYIQPTDETIQKDFDRVWNSELKEKVATKTTLTPQDVDRLASIASCASLKLPRQERFNLLKALLVLIKEYSGSLEVEKYEDLALDILSTTPVNQAKDLFNDIHSDEDIFWAFIWYVKDANWFGRENNKTRLAKEYFKLFNKGYSSKQDLLGLYNNFTEGYQHLYYYGLHRDNVGLSSKDCKWDISTSITFNSDGFKFTETPYQVEIVDNDTYDSGWEFKCVAQEPQTFTVPLKSIISVQVVDPEATLFGYGADDGILVMPALSYYLLIRAKQDKDHIDKLKGIMTTITIITPLDEFWLLGRLLKYAKNRYKISQFARLKKLAKEKRLILEQTEETLNLQSSIKQNAKNLENCFEIVLGKDDELGNILKLNKSSYPKGINLSGYSFKARDGFFDIIIHYDDVLGKFIVRTEKAGMDVVLTSAELGELFKIIPDGVEIRLLSCNSAEAAKELSRHTGGKSFYASDGVVEIFEDGAVYHSKMNKYQDGKVVSGELPASTSRPSGNFNFKSLGKVLHGTGPLKGTIEVSLNVKSIKKFLSFEKEKIVDFVYDIKTNRLLMYQSSDVTGGHTTLHNLLGISQDKALGGRLRFSSDGKFITSEWSGHTGQNWELIENARSSFKSFIESLNNGQIIHIHKTGAVQP